MAWTDSWNRQVWQEGTGPKIATWLLLPVAAAIVGFEVLIGITLTWGYAAQAFSGGWIAALIALALTLVGPVAAVTGWRSALAASASHRTRLGGAVRRGAAVGVFPLVLLAMWLGTVSFI